MAKIQCNVISYILNRTVDIDIILPTVTIPEARKRTKEEVCHIYPHKYPVLYLFHGYGNNLKQWCGYTNIELYAEERQIAVVMISAENKFYLNHEQDLFYDFIEEELPEFITNTFPISNEAKHTYIAGLSMGGYGALYHGLKNPQKYNAIGAFSAAIDIKDEAPSLNDFIKQEKLPLIYITCGEDDFLYKNNIIFVSKLKDMKADYTWVSEAAYAHEWRFWDLCIERFLDWLPRTDAYFDIKRKV